MRPMRHWGLDLAASRGVDRRCAMAGPPQPAGHDQIAINGRLPVVADARVALHIHEIDTPTLSPECQQPSHQSVNSPPTRSQMT